MWGGCVYPLRLYKIYDGDTSEEHRFGTKVVQTGLRSERNFCPHTDKTGCGSVGVIYSSSAVRFGLPVSSSDEENVVDHEHIFEYSASL